MFMANAQVKIIIIVRGSRSWPQKAGGWEEGAIAARRTYGIQKTVSFSQSRQRQQRHVQLNKTHDTCRGMYNIEHECSACFGFSRCSKR